MAGDGKGFLVSDGMAKVVNDLSEIGESNNYRGKREDFENDFGGMREAVYKQRGGHLAHYIIKAY